MDVQKIQKQYDVLQIALKARTDQMHEAQLQRDEAIALAKMCEKFSNYEYLALKFIIRLQQRRATTIREALRLQQRGAAAIREELRLQQRSAASIREELRLQKLPVRAMLVVSDNGVKIDLVVTEARAVNTMSTTSVPTASVSTISVSTQTPFASNMIPFHFTSAQVTSFLTGAVISNEITSRLLKQEDVYRPCTYVAKKSFRGVKNLLCKGRDKSSGDTTAPTYSSVVGVPTTLPRQVMPPIQILS